MKKTTNPYTRLRLIIGIIATIIIIILVVSLIGIIDQASRNVSIRFMIAPSSATITMNGKTYDTATTYHISPGEYEIAIEKPGFDSYHQQLTLNADEDKTIAVSLSVQEGNENYYKEHPDEAYALETIWTDQMISGSEIVMKDNPLLNVLPINVEYYIQNKQYVHYQISFSITTPEQVTILINDYTGGNHDAALERIRTEGYNPDDYSIEYRDLSNLYTGTDNF